MKKLLMIGVAAGALTLSACGGPKHFNEEHAKYDPSLSKAMNLALLTGLTTMEGPLKDSKPVKSVEPTTDPTKAIGAASSAALMAAQSTGAMLDAGMGIGGSMGMSGLGLLMGASNHVYQPVLSSHIFAWMPLGNVHNEVEATNKMAAILYTNVKEALPSNISIISDVTPYAYAAFSDAKAFTISFSFRGREYSVEGNISVPEQINNTWLTKENSYYWSYMQTSSDTSPTIGVALYVKKGESWETPKDDFNNLTLLKAVSRKLPEWTYIYIAPDMLKKTSPYFLNKGKVLPFIKPN